jgi:iron(III) transport system ATP-binding protein
MKNQSVPVALEKVTKIFRDPRSGHDVTAVGDADIEIASGELVTLLGPSGCGKTTTLRMIAGFELPTRGRILIGGNDVTFLPPNKRETATVFQSYGLFPHLDVYENVAYGLRIRKVGAAELDRRVMEALGLVGLDELARRAPSRLSGGQQQRVALARSLVMEPELLLLDEPFSALDAFTRASLQRDVRSIAKRLGFNLIIVTHDIDEAVIMADRAVIMAGAPGKIKDEIEVPLPDPRQRQDPAVQAMRARLMDAFHTAAGKPAQDEEAAMGNGEEVVVASAP